MSDVTRILAAIEHGDAKAADELLPLVYQELRHLAAARMAHEAPGQTLQPTALVHEAWLRVTGGENKQWDGRGHFFAAAAEAMRRILVDHARHRHADKRGGAEPALAVGLAVGIKKEREIDLIALDEALDVLSSLDPQQARVIELRFFGGLTLQEIAEALDISTATVTRDWVTAKAWLYDRLNGAGDHAPGTDHDS